MAKKESKKKEEEVLADEEWWGNSERQEGQTHAEFLLGKWKENHAFLMDFAQMMMEQKESDIKVREELFLNWHEMQSIFNVFKKNNDDNLNLTEFNKNFNDVLLKRWFRNGTKLIEFAKNHKELEDEDNNLREVYAMHKEANAKFIKQFESEITLGIGKRKAIDDGGASIKARAELKKERVKNLIKSGKISLPIKNGFHESIFKEFGLTKEGGYTESTLKRYIREIKAKP